MNRSNQYSLHFDGCCRGNPGLSGTGAVIHKNGEILWTGYEFIGINKTNNQSEYTALITGLKKAIDLGIKELMVYGDSLLVINQMNYKFKVTSPSLLLLLHGNAVQLVKQLENVQFTHVYRNKNIIADNLANRAVDEYMNKIKYNVI
jgi:ribonuclease HI